MRITLDLSIEMLSQRLTRIAFDSGLGAGISASAFMRNNITSTVIEIDPAVYEASKRFFGLPTRNLDQVALLDANFWVRGRIERLENRNAEAAKAAESCVPVESDDT